MADDDRMAMVVEDYRVHLVESLAYQSALGAKIEALENGYQSFAAAIDAKTKAATELKNTISHLTAENGKLRGKVSALETDLEDAKEDVRALTERVEFMSAESVAYQQTATPTKSKPANDSVRERLKRAEVTIEELNKEKAKWKAHMADRMQLVRTNVQMKQQLADLRGEVERLQGELAAVVPQKEVGWLGLVTVLVMKHRERVAKVAAWGRIRARVKDTEQVSIQESSVYLHDKLDELKIRHRNLFTLVLRLTRLREVTVVDLCRCGVPPDWLETLFASLSDAGNLRELDLGRNKVGDAVVPYIANWAARGKHLVKLGLGHTGMTAKGVSELLTVVKTSTTLEAIDVSGSPAPVPDLVVFLQTCTSLRALSIGNVGLQHSADLKPLTEVIVASQVSSLDISSNPIPSALLKPLLSHLAVKQWLQLTLSDLDLTDTHVDGICQLIQQSSEFQSIGLANTRLTSSGLAQVCSYLTSCPSLTKMDASGTAVLVATVCDLLAKCASLVELHLKDVRMTDEECAQLGESVAQATNLQVCLIDPPKGTR